MPARPSVANVLNGSAKIDMAGLFGLIHEINPTARGLPAKEQARRYEAKARLQSMLIERFAESLLFEPGEAEGVVSVRHASLGYDACHALVSELSEEARSIVRRAIDELVPHGNPTSARQPSPSRRGRAGAPASISTDPLSRGRTALAEYDFEGARALFEEACETSPDSVDPVRAVLELLVDHLADYEAALARRSSLGTEARRDAAVRAKIALAAANVGDLDECESWLAGVEVEEAATAWLSCADQAAAGGQLARAEACCRRAKEIAPSLGADVRRKVEQARAARLAEREAELEQMPSASQRRAAAQAIIAEFPESRAARAVLAEAMATSREEKTRAQLSSARDFAMAGDLDAAASLLRAELVGLASPARDELVRELEAIEARRANERNQQAVDRVISLLESEPTRAVVAFLSLPPSSRKQVRGRADHSALAIAEQASAGGQSDEEIARAAILVAELQASSPEPSAALARLNPLREALVLLPHGARLLATMEARLAEERKSAAESALVEASRLFSVGSALEARAVVANIEGSDLDDASRSELDRLRPLVQSAARVAEWQQDLSAARNRGALFEALEIASRLMLELDAGTPSRREVELIADDIRASVDTHYRVSRFDGGYDGWFRRLGERYRRAHHCLRDDADEVVLCWAAGSTLCLHRVDLEGRALATMVFTIPGPNEACTEYDCVVVAGRAQLSSEAGPSVVVDLDSLRIERIIEAPPRSNTVVDQRFVAVDQAMFEWVHDRSGRCRVTDITERGAAREIADMFFAHPFMTGGRTMVVASRGRGERPALYSASGRLLNPLPEQLEVAEATANPAGEGVILLCTGWHDSAPPLPRPVARASADPDLAPMGLAACDSSGALVAGTALEGADGDAPHSMVSSSAKSAVFVSFGVDLETRSVMLAAVEVGGDSLRELWRVPFSSSAVLVCDSGGSRAFMYEAEQDRLVVQELTRAPAGARTAAPGVHPEAWMNAFLHCSLGSRYRPSKAGFDALLKKVGRDGMVARARELEASASHDPEAMLELAQAVDHTSHEHPSLVDALLDHHPTHAASRLWRADRMAQVGRWDAVWGWVEGVDDCPPELECHLHHLRGLALATQGRFQDATEALLLARTSETNACRVDSVLEHLSEIEEAQREDSGGAALATVLARALTKADRQIEAGDLVAALAELEVTAIVSLAELSYLARAAYCHLGLEASGAAACAKKRLVLSQFVAANDAGGMVRRELIMPNRWPRERLADLAGRARTWLSEQSHIPPAR